MVGHLIMANDTTTAVRLYLASIAVALLSHFIFLAETNLHPTIQVLLAFVAFTIVLGIATNFGRGERGRAGGVPRYRDSRTLSTKSATP